MFIPSYLVLLSIIVLVVQSIFSSGPVRRPRANEAYEAATGGGSGVAISATRTGFVSALNYLNGHVETSVELIIFLFQVSRFLVVLTLLGLAIFSIFQERGQQHVSPSSVVGAPKKHLYVGVSLTKREWLNLTLSLTYVR